MPQSESPARTKLALAYTHLHLPTTCIRESPGAVVARRTQAVVTSPQSDLGPEFRCLRTKTQTSLVLLGLAALLTAVLSVLAALLPVDHPARLVLDVFYEVVHIHEVLDLELVLG